jgi:hypothetical protein
VTRADQDTHALLQSGLAKAQKQAEHLRYTLTHLDALPSLEDSAALERFEALTARFARLQDLLIRPFRAIAYLEMEEERVERIPDLLNLMEKRGIVPSAVDWPIMRRLRNAIAHEYWDSQAELHELLQGVRQYSQRLIETVDRLAAYCKKL